MHPYHIEVAIQAKADEGVTLLFQRLSFVPATVARSHTGSRCLEDNSKRAYKKHIRGLQYFCPLIGDYDSLLMLLDQPPEPFCPSMSPNTISDFINFKRQATGSIFVRIGDNKQCLDVLGRPIYCQGDWNDPRNVDQMLSAVTVIHSARGQRGGLIDRCDECSQLCEQNSYLGCRFHRGTPRLWRNGSPKLSELVENTAKGSWKQSSDYVAQGDSPLSPWELMDIRTHLLASNNDYDFQLFVMVLLSCKLFLRSEEIARMRFDDFIPDLGIVTENGFIEALAVKVQGKCDSSPVTCMIWAEDSLSLLCPIRHLLIWIFRRHNNSGENYLFPGNYDGHISPEAFHERFKAVCTKILDRDGPFGSHSCRKTAYLLAVWGGGEEGDMMLSARHRTISQAMKYKRDALFLLNVAKANNRHIDHVVPKWKPIVCKDLQMGRASNIGGAFECKTLRFLASNFVGVVCKCLPSSSILRLLESVIQMNKPTTTLQSITNFCQDHLTPTLQSQLMVLLEKLTLEIRYSLSQTNEIQTEENTEQTTIISMESNTSSNINMLHVCKEVNESKTKSKRGGTFDFDGRLQLKKIKLDREKLSKILQYQAIMPPDASTMTEAARVFAITSIVPITSCLQRHCNGDIDIFLNRWKSFNHSNFGKRCCSGKEEKCKSVASK